MRERITGMRAAGLAVVLGAALAGCSTPVDGAAPSAPATTTAPSPTPVGSAVPAVRTPAGSTTVLEWTDQTGAVPAESLRLTGQRVAVTVSVACDTEDASVGIVIDGVMTTGSDCVYDPGTERSGAGGNTATIEGPFDLDATVSVTTDPADARWSAAVTVSP